MAFSACSSGIRPSAASCWNFWISLRGKPIVGGFRGISVMVVEWKSNLHDVGRSLNHSESACGRHMLRIRLWKGAGHLNYRNGICREHLMIP